MTTETTKTTVDFLIDQLDDKRIYRIYRELELNMRIKPRKRLVREQPEPLAVPYAHNEIWSMDFMHDQLADGRSIRLFNVIDDYNRSEEHTSELQSLMRISYAVFCLKKKKKQRQQYHKHNIKPHTQTIK